MWYRIVLERQSRLSWVCFSVPKEIIFFHKTRLQAHISCEFIAVSFEFELKSMSWLP